jgi:hypothetical protein
MVLSNLSYDVKIQFWFHGCYSVLPAGAGQPCQDNRYGVINNGFGVMCNGYRVKSNEAAVISNGYGVINNDYGVISNGYGVSCSYTCRRWTAVPG